MYIRLGFATAVHVDPDVLLVDEVLSVGDESFQRKCLDKVRTFQSEGRTIVVVTHAADLVRQMCDRAAALDHGKLVIEGDPNDVIREFRERLMSGVTSAADVSPEMARSELSPLWGKVKIDDVEVRYPDIDRHNVQPGESLCFDVTLSAAAPVDDVVIGIAIYGPLGQLIFGTNSALKGATLGVVNGTRRVRFDLGSVPLLDGTYGLTVGAHTLSGLVYDHWEQQRRFEVATGGKDQGLISLPVKIEVEDNQPSAQGRGLTVAGIRSLLRPLNRQLRVHVEEVSLPRLDALSGQIEDVRQATVEVRRIVTDDLDASNEVAALLGRTLQDSHRFGRRAPRPRWPRCATELDAQPLRGAVMRPVLFDLHGAQSVGPSRSRRGPVRRRIGPGPRAPLGRRRPSTPFSSTPPFPSRAGSSR